MKRERAMAYMLVPWHLHVLLISTWMGTKEKKFSKASPMEASYQLLISSIQRNYLTSHAINFRDPVGIVLIAQDSHFELTEEGTVLYLEAFVAVSCKSSPLFESLYTLVAAECQRPNLSPWCIPEDLWAKYISIRLIAFGWERHMRQEKHWFLQIKCRIQQCESASEWNCKAQIKATLATSRRRLFEII